jgi:hypothetical protein
MSELDRVSLDRTLPPRSGYADWDEVLRGAGAARERRVRGLVAVVAALLVLVVGTASAFGTVRDLLGFGSRPGDALHTLDGKRGSFFLRDDAYPDEDRSRGWRIEVVPRLAQGGLASSGQYAHVTGSGWYVRFRPMRSPRLPRLEGIVTRPGEATQRIVITEKLITEKRGVRGVFVLTPLEPGILKRDSGTVTITRG